MPELTGYWATRGITSDFDALWLDVPEREPFVVSLETPERRMIVASTPPTRDSRFFELYQAALRER